MIGIEMLGHLATITSVGAMMLKCMIKLRLVSIIGSLMWVVYAITIGATSVLTSSLLFVGVNSVGIYKELKSKKEIK